MDIPFESFCIVETADEERRVFELAQRLQDAAESQTVFFLTSPPFAAMKTVASEQDRQSRRWLARVRSTVCGAPHRQRLHPGESHADPESAQQRTP